MMSKVIDKNIFEIETVSNNLVIIFKIIIWLCSLYMIHDSLLLMCSKNVLKMSRLFLHFPWKQTAIITRSVFWTRSVIWDVAFFAEIAHDWKPLNTLYVFPNFQISSFSFRLLWTIAAEILTKTYGKNNSELSVVNSIKQWYIWFCWTLFSVPYDLEHWIKGKYSKQMTYCCFK